MLVSPSLVRGVSVATVFLCGVAIGIVFGLGWNLSMIPLVFAMLAPCAFLAWQLTTNAHGRTKGVVA